jgi:hypothetical protein
MRPGLFRPHFPRWIEAARVGAALGLAGCNTRDRLVFSPSPPPGSGPLTTIDNPSLDTTVTAGPDFLVTGFSRDSDGVDTIYSETQGGVSNFPPIIGMADSVRFGLPLTTNGQGGQTITLRVFAVDRLGARGDTAIRRITVR